MRRRGFLAALFGAPVAAAAAVAAPKVEEAVKHLAPPPVDEVPLYAAQELRSDSFYCTCSVSVMEGWEPLSPRARRRS